MVTAELLAARRALVGAADVRALLDHIGTRVERLLREMPVIPAAKSLMSQDGGVCPADGEALVFDPWSPDAHRCTRCQQVQRGPRHDRAWARWQHLWLAERAGDLATLAALGATVAAAAPARALLTAYGERYFTYPNRDNVLGPARLFFSTYLESIWLTQYLAAAQVLRAADLMDDATTRAVNTVADEAANLIGEYNEGGSNRQTWNNAALCAIGTWFGDDELVSQAALGETGLVAHLLEGFRADGQWYEGENYHLFALRGLVAGILWARAAGHDMLAHPRLAERFGLALLAPARSALPDFTFPARKDSHFGVSLAQPMFLDTWEVAAGLLAEGAPPVVSWLHALYQRPAAAPEGLDAYLHDAGRPLPPASSRRLLSWWSALSMLPQLPPAEPWSAESWLFEHQGLAILRPHGAYVSLECGPSAGGHDHPDRLHLTLHDGRTHWLADFGTGSYVARDLFWYRSTLSHNAPRVDGLDQDGRGADCAAFDAPGSWGWARGVWDEVTRTVVAGPQYTIDLVVLGSRAERQIEVPWHLTGNVAVDTPGTWRDDELKHEFVERVQRFEPRDAGAVRASAVAPDGTLSLWFLGASTLLAATGPGRPGGGGPERFLIQRARGQNVRLLTVLVPPGGEVREVRWQGDLIEIETADGTHRHRDRGTQWSVEAGDGAVTLAGGRDPQRSVTPFLNLDAPAPARGAALAVSDAPACDGSLDGFDDSERLALDLEDQYRRSEEPWAGAGEFSATVWVNWTAEAVYVAVDVVKADPWFRPAGAAPLRLDNECDDIHSDGVQLYLLAPEGNGFDGYLAVPEAGGRVRVRGVQGTGARAADVRARWAATDGGYRVTLALPWPDGVTPHPGGTLGFDVVVNEMYGDRERRAGQLAWSGGAGWVWLRGDRADPARLGVLELVG